MESIEAAAIGEELGTLFFEHLPDRPVRPFRMGMRFGPGDAFCPSAMRFSSSIALPTRKRGVKKQRSRTRPTWFSTWPFSPADDAGVQATGSIRWC